MGNREQKTCQNCHKNFTIEGEDFDFYEKIKVPGPTFCPQCRLIRRMSFMDSMPLSWRVCGLCGKRTISRVYSNEKSPLVYCNKCWWSDNWEPLDFGLEVDFSKPFFEQFSELIKRIPWNATCSIESTNINSEYCNSYSYLKNCYLLFQSDYSENCFYGAYIEHSKDSAGLFMADYCELCCEGVNLRKCNQVFFSVDCEECHNVYFSKNLINCSNCFGCINLRNKQYFIFNQPFSKNEYSKKLQDFNLGSFKNILDIQKKSADFFKKYPHKFMHSRHNVNVSGDYIYDSKNTFKSYQVLGAKDSKFCQFITLSPINDVYDMTLWGGNATRAYECMGAGGGQNNIKFGWDLWSNSVMDLQYCMRIVAPNTHLFGCVSLRNKQYCILNKQYTKESFDKLRIKIIEHMNTMPYTDKKGRVYKYGEFFPAELSPFCYNKTIAQEYFPLTKEQAIEQGYSWKNKEPRNYQIEITTDQLPDNIKDVDDSIIGKVIECANSGSCSATSFGCTEAFKIIEPELQFYKRMNLPLSRLCPNCRHYQRLKQRNPLKLWKRQCQCGGVASNNQQPTSNYKYQNTAKHFHEDSPCPNTFETSYSPDRPEIVYCEQCYLQEVV